MRFGDGDGNQNPKQREAHTVHFTAKREVPEGRGPYKRQSVVEPLLRLWSLVALSFQRLHSMRTPYLQRKPGWHAYLRLCRGFGKHLQGR